MEYSLDRNLKKFLKYKTKNEIITKIIQAGGVLTNVTINISSSEIYNKLFKKNDEVDQINVFLNENFNFMTFKITKYNCEQVKKYISDTQIDPRGKKVNDDTSYIMSEILKIDTDAVYYLSDFYTFNGNSIISHDKIIDEVKRAENVRSYENVKILQKDKINELLLKDTKGIPTVILKMLINYYINSSPNKKIIFCCEPILGIRENSITYKNYSESSDKRYSDLIKYYSSLGLTMFASVFMILHLYIEYYGYNQSSASDKAADLARRKTTNSNFPDRKFFETRMFMINRLDKLFDAENINAPATCKFVIKKCQEIKQ
jgi:uncharacterized protein YdaT